MTGILAMHGLEELILEGVMRGFRILVRGIKKGKIGKLKCLALRNLLDIDMDGLNKYYFCPNIFAIINLNLTKKTTLFVCPNKIMTMNPKMSLRI